VTAGFERTATRNQPGHDLLEQVKLLAAQFGRRHGQPRDVSPWSCQTSRKSTPDWISVDRHDDGNPRRRALGRLRSRCCPCHDHVDLELHEFGREGRKPLGVVPVPSALDDDVLALDVTQIAQALEECAPDERGLRACWRITAEQADAKYFRWHLRLCRQRRGDQDKESRQPCTPIHHPITASGRDRLPWWSRWALAATPRAPARTSWLPPPCGERGVQRREPERKRGSRRLQRRVGQHRFTIDDGRGPPLPCEGNILDGVKSEPAIEAFQAARSSQGD
jgi:hypothetical protein